MRPELAGFRKPLKTPSTKEVGLAMVRATEDGLVCSCGALVSRHPRARVREKQAERHIDKKHSGRGVVF